MKGSLVTQRPQADGSRNKAVVRKAIADAVAVERKAMKLEQEAKQNIEQAGSVQESEVKTEMAGRKATAKKETVNKTTKAAVQAEVKEAPKAEEPKATSAKAAVKEAVKEVAKETAAKAAPVKSAAKEAVKEAKEVAAKATTTAKAAVKKAAVTEEIFVQYGNREVMTKDIVEKVKAAYVAEGHDADGIKKIRMYIKPEENMVYYVVNDGYASGVSLY